MSTKHTPSERIKMLGLKSASNLDPKPKITNRPIGIQDVIEGELLKTSKGEVFTCQKTFAPDYRHGDAPINVDIPSSWFAALSHDPRLNTLSKYAYAYLDTETSGLAGGTGTYAFLVGIARFTNEGLLVKQFFMRDPDDETSLLEAVAEFLAPCMALVTFNGKTFDAPLLATRYSLHGIPIPFLNYAHVDLLPLARRLWRDRLPTRALKYLEENILLAPRSFEEVPGYEIPYLYFDYLRSGDASPLTGVFYHNTMDVVAMVALMKRITSMLKDPFDGTIAYGQDIIALGKIFEEFKEWEIASRLFDRGLAMDIPEEDHWEAVRHLTRIQKLQGNLNSAIKLWEKAAKEGHIYACEELAKYHEHTSKDNISALIWTVEALNLLERKDFPRNVHDRWVDVLTHRAMRLQKKVAL